MSESCAYSSRFAELVELPQDDPFWSHARECPDCRGMLAAYALFQDPPAVGSGADDLAEDEARLAARLEEQLDMRPVVKGRRPGRWGRPGTWYALAAVLLAACGLSWWGAGPTLEESAPGPVPGVLRGEGDGGTGYSAHLADGRLQVMQPEEYGGPALLVLLDADLAEMGRLELTGAEESLELAPGVRPTFVQIFHLDRGDTVGRSPVLPVVKE